MCYNLLITSRYPSQAASNEISHILLFAVYKIEYIGYNKINSITSMRILLVREKIKRTFFRKKGLIGCHFREKLYA